jgi:hypothetical protein
MLRTPTPFVRYQNLKNAVRVDGYIFRNYKSGDSDNCLQVLHDGKIIFRRTVFSLDNGYTLGQPEDKKWKVPAIPNGTDITGRGHPDMIVSWWTGGAHCCLMHYVFELEPKFKLLATLNARDTWPAYFADLDKNGHYYYIAEDWTFAGWPGSYVSSPAAPIILQFVEDNKGGSYHLAMDKMRQPSPSPAQWKKLLDEDQQAIVEYGLQSTTIASTIWTDVMRLIYSGHSDLAWKYLDESWPNSDTVPDFSRKDKDGWLENFCSTLKTSPYWPDLAPTLKDTPPACANAKPDHQK